MLADIKDRVSVHLSGLRRHPLYISDLQARIRWLGLHVYLCIYICFPRIYTENEHLAWEAHWKRRIHR